MLDQFFTLVGSAYASSRSVAVTIGVIFSAMLFYKKFFRWIGLFFTRKFPEAKKNHKYAILIPARNEASVIANLLDSIHQQD